MYKILFIIGVAAIHINAQTYNCPYSYSGTDACKLCYPNCKQFCEDHNICCHQHWTGVFDPQLGLNEGYGYELVPRKPKKFTCVKNVCAPSSSSYFYVVPPACSKDSDCKNWKEKCCYDSCLRESICMKGMPTF